MNIFYLSHNPKECAEYHVSRHISKMMIEYSQLLSTAHRVLDGQLTTITNSTGRKSKQYILNNIKNDILYKSTHINHPSAIWVRESAENYQWLWNLTNEVSKEYTFRYGKIHKSSLLLGTLKDIPKNISNKPFTQPAQAMPDEYKDNDSIIAYRNYYKHGKKHLHDWKNRNVPTFILE